ncbi:hypothetical protein NL676_034150 [Syzygium grande]|nr:hypothetical protein NL676_034150 [Syzygium grande]
MAARDGWVRTAMAEDRMVAELLMRLRREEPRRHAASAPRSSSAAAAAAAAAPPAAAGVGDPAAAVEDCVPVRRRVAGEEVRRLGEEQPHDPALVERRDRLLLRHRRRARRLQLAGLRLLRLHI